MHINRTAGTSLEAALGGRKPKPFHPEKHMDCNSMIKLYGKNLWRDYFTFSIVRNPWDRMVSMFTWRKKIGILPEKLSFESFVMNWNEWKIHRNKKLKNPNLDTSKLDRTGLLEQPQLSWFNGELNFDFVARFENIQEDFSYICDRLNLKMQLPHEHKTNHKHYSLHYNTATKKEVEKIWIEDIDHFKYKFD